MNQENVSKSGTKKKSLPSSLDNKTHLNRSRSLENIRKILPRQVKVNINYKESRTYARRQLDESIDISKRSTLTPRSPETSRKNYNELDNTGSDNNISGKTFDESIRKQHQSTFRNADEDDHTSNESFHEVSTSKPNETLDLKRLLKTENISRTETSLSVFEKVLEKKCKNKFRNYPSIGEILQNLKNLKILPIKTKKLLEIVKLQNQIKNKIIS